MRIAFVVFNGMTTMDFIGAYDPLVRLKRYGYMPDLRWDICAYTEDVHDLDGLRIVPTQVREPLGAYDIVIIPGGLGTRTLVDDAGFIAWIGSAASCPLKVSVCTGSLLLGAAGFLAGRKATTHRSAFADLQKYCVLVVDERVVDEGEVITARGVTSSIDLGLYLCEKLAGREAREHIRQQMDYQS
ncbi:MAG: DJ-1/PfpI family protein [Ktedonobacteraceae bacterium]